jgi:hypothetical protein
MSWYSNKSASKRLKEYNQNISVEKKEIISQNIICGLHKRKFAATAIDEVIKANIDVKNNEKELKANYEDKIDEEILENEIEVLEGMGEESQNELQTIEGLLNYWTDDDAADVFLDVASVLSHEEENDDNQQENNIPLYSILEDSAIMAKEFCSYKLPNNNLDKLHPMTNFTIGEFARDISSVLQRNLISAKGEAEIFGVLHKHFSQIAKLPMNLSKKNKVYVSTIHKYSEPQCLFKSFDICRNSCCVFVGELSNNIECPKCYECRYLEKNNKTDSKTAALHLYYKPIIPLLHNLLSQPGFLSAVNYKYTYVNPNSNKNYKYTDISNGSNYKFHMNAMEENYKTKCNPKDNIISVPILFSEFYDGVQLHKKKVNF